MPSFKSIFAEFGLKTYLAFSRAVKINHTYLISVIFLYASAILAYHRMQQKSARNFNPHRPAFSISYKGRTKNVFLIIIPTYEGEGPGFLVFL